uniref:Phosphodiester glycosidase domain-containing protein n=1 Tax=Racemicystis crocea TaxID=1707966 RepID=A0A3S7V0H9_9BACT|nr:hypothetical protein [Racemicystis crocea]
MKTKPSRWRRRALIGLGVSLLGIPGLWMAIHHIPGFGPALADGVRAIVGPAPVAWAENFAYGIQDRIDQWRYEGAAPKTFWEAPPAGATNTPVATLPASAVRPTPSSAGATPELEGFPPPPVNPPYERVAATGDGVWIAMNESAAPGQAPTMAKTVIHPDRRRSFAAVAVVAIDLRRTSLHLVAGTTEPYSTTVPIERRPGLVPREAAADIIAAFNGGFKAIHGHYGMMVEGEILLPPRKISCTIAMYKGGAIRIRTWPALEANAADMLAYRQTPPCLVEGGEVNAVLEDNQYNRNWGATVSGDTVIRRSAVGIDASGHTLFYALGDAVTAQSLARAMKAVGAESAAQLDVNYAYPRFLLYEREGGAEPPHVGSSLIPGTKFTGYEYVTNASERDFFYITRKRPDS